MRLFRAAALDLAFYADANRAFTAATAGRFDEAADLALGVVQRGRAVAARPRVTDAVATYAAALDAAGTGMREEWRSERAGRTWSPAEYALWCQTIAALPPGAALPLVLHLGADLAGAVARRETDVPRETSVLLRDARSRSVPGRPGAPVQRAAAVLARAAFDAQDGLRLCNPGWLGSALTPQVARGAATWGTPPVRRTR